MRKDNKAPQAFPYSGVGDDMNYSRGMSLRDYFAAKAMHGLLANGGTDAGLMSHAAYIVADAMLAARAV